MPRRNSVTLLASANGCMTDCSQPSADLIQRYPSHPQKQDDHGPFPRSPTSTPARPFRVSITRKMAESDAVLRVRSTGEKGREQKLLDDSLVTVLSPSSVECRLCSRTIKLSDKSAFDTHHWDNHRRRCLKVNNDQVKKEHLGADLGAPSTRRRVGRPPRQPPQSSSPSPPLCSPGPPSPLNPSRTLVPAPNPPPTEQVRIPSSNINTPLGPHRSRPPSPNQPCITPRHGGDDDVNDPDFRHSRASRRGDGASVPRSVNLVWIDPEQERQVAWTLSQMLKIRRRQYC